MKHSIKKPLVLFLAISFLLGCKKESTTETVQPVNDEEMAITTSPVSSGELPDGGKAVTENDVKLFPTKSTKPVSTESLGVTDFVNFDDEMALTILPDYAASTFAYAPFYIEPVGNAWIHVKENNSGNYKTAFKSNYGHYHLSYQNFDPCITNGKFGKPVNGGCASINPVKEPRKVNTHDGSEWLKIYAYDYTSSSRTFDLLSIKVTKGPIQLWFKKTNGDWLHWSSMGTGTWNVSAYCTSIKEVLISSSGNSSPIGFDNLKVVMPYN